MMAFMKNRLRKGVTLQRVAVQETPLKNNASLAVQPRIVIFGPFIRALEKALLKNGIHALTHASQSTGSS